MNQILIVEDDQNLSESLHRYLKNEGYFTVLSSSLAEARTKLGDNPSLVVLDWMLPDGQGIDLLRDLRRKEPLLPVILLTARNELVDKVVGLETGANDYLTKPFEPRELLARIRAQLRAANLHGMEKDPKIISIAGIKMNHESRTVIFQGRSAELTKMEFDLLKLFMEHPGRVFPRESLLNKVWGYENYPTTRTVDNHIVQLRQKFGPDLFETVRGIGYRFRALNGDTKK